MLALRGLVGHGLEMWGELRWTIDPVDVIRRAGPSLRSAGAARVVRRDAPVDFVYQESVKDDSGIHPPSFAVAKCGLLDARALELTDRGVWCGSVTER
ncbi:MAG: hypothetical protein BGO98_11080 [Myxococcales bacterium 68-20]|nr:MAG: hypothetical protein BGO98_11080 [Myxococcales bacterium 68-20]